MFEEVTLCYPELVEYVSDQDREQRGRSFACIAWLVRPTTLACCGRGVLILDLSTIPVDLVAHPRDLNLIFVAFGGQSFLWSSTSA